MFDVAEAFSGAVREYLNDSPDMDLSDGLRLSTVSLKRDAAFERMRMQFSSTEDLIEALVDAGALSRTGPATLKVSAAVLAAARRSPPQRDTPSPAAAPPRQLLPLAPQRVPPPPKRPAERQPVRKCWFGAGAVGLGTLASCLMHVDVVIARADEILHRLNQTVGLAERIAMVWNRTRTLFADPYAKSI